MSKHLILEIIILALLLFLLFFVLNPFDLFMPSMNVALAGCIALFLLLIVTTFFWQEKSGDEREEFHRARAAQVSFFAGASILTLGVFMNLLNHEVNPWLL